MKIREYYGVRENERDTFERLYKIELTETRFSRTQSGKSWKKNPDSEQVTEIQFDNYFNYLSSVEFFKNLGGSERVTKGYTPAGYIATNLVSINPEKSEKVIRHFKIKNK